MRRRHSFNAQLRNIIMASRDDMAAFLLMSPSNYEKAEIGSRIFPLKAMRLLWPLENAFGNATRQFGFPTGMINCDSGLLKNSKRFLSSQIGKFSLKKKWLALELKYCKENWEAGSAQLNMLLEIKSNLTEDYPLMPVIDRGIILLTRRLQKYSPEQQKCLSEIINALDVIERSSKEMLGWGETEE